MAKWAQGVFTPKNPAKYIGKHKPRYRSGWELTVMTMFDNNKAITHWASESIAIPYRNPLTGKISRYVPDFFVVYANKFGKVIAEIVEVKPKSQTSLLEAKSKHDQASAVVNQAKFKAATDYCRSNGFTFRVITESDIFKGTKNR